MAQILVGVFGPREYYLLVLAPTGPAPRAAVQSREERADPALGGIEARRPRRPNFLSHVLERLDDPVRPQQTVREELIVFAEALEGAVVLREVAFAVAAAARTTKI